MSTATLSKFFLPQMRCLFEGRLYLKYGWIKELLDFKIPVLLFSVTNRNVSFILLHWAVPLYWVRRLFVWIGDLLSYHGYGDCIHLFGEQIWVKPLVKTAWEMSLKMMQNMTSCPDQNDTAVITGELSFKQNRYLSYNLGQKCQEKWTLLCLVSR